MLCTTWQLAESTGQAHGSLMASRCSAESEERSSSSFLIAGRIELNCTNAMTTIDNQWRDDRRNTSAELANQVTAETSCLDILRHFFTCLLWCAHLASSLQEYIRIHNTAIHSELRRGLCSFWLRRLGLRKVLGASGSRRPLAHGAQLGTWIEQIWVLNWTRTLRIFQGWKSVGICCHDTACSTCAIDAIGLVWVEGCERTLMGAHGIRSNDRATSHLPETLHSTWSTPIDTSMTWRPPCHNFNNLNLQVNRCEIKTKSIKEHYNVTICHFNMWQTCRKTWEHLWRCNRSTCVRLPWAASTKFDSYINEFWASRTKGTICHQNVQPWRGLARGTSGYVTMTVSSWFFLIFTCYISYISCSRSTHDLWISSHQLRTTRLWRWFWLKIGTWTLPTSPVPAGVHIPPHATSHRGSKTFQACG